MEELANLQSLIQKILYNIMVYEESEVFLSVLRQSFERQNQAKLNLPFNKVCDVEHMNNPQNNS